MDTIDCSSDFTLAGDYEGGDWSGWDTDTGDEQGNLPGGDE